MSIKSKTERAAGYVKEETGEALNKQRMANEGRALRNQGRIKEGKAPKMGTPNTQK